MADDLLTLSELVTLNDQNLADLNVSDLLDDAPLFKRLAADIASNGTEHKYVKETGAPVVGFRAANDGRDHDVSEDTLVTITLQILDASHKIDKALADAYQKGGASAWIARENFRHLKASFAHAEKQIINGTGNDAAGFTGLVDASTLDGLADAMVIGAGGTTALTSVYAIRTNNDGNDCTLITGQDGNIEISESVTQFVAGATGTYPAYVTPITGWLGLQIGSAQSVGRLANLDAGSNTLTDDLLAQLIELFPSTRQPNLLVMNRRSLRQLQNSRTATNPTGAPAPFPQSAFNIPIVPTDSVLNTETAVA